jgi:malonyl-CoA decarboxylase
MTALARRALCRYMTDSVRASPRPSLLHLKRYLRSASREGRAASRAAGHHAGRVVALCHALLSERGEVSGARLAHDAVAAYRELDEASLALFFDLLVRQFSPDPAEVERCADAYRDEPSQANALALQQAVEPPRQELFRRLNMASGGTALLVDMRGRLLQRAGEKPDWSGIEADLAHLLASWFNRGFLNLQRIDWRTSALVLEKLIRYEAVHEIRDWNDLHRRLGADRRCYAFFHPALPDEPLIFIEVALTRGMSAKVQPLLEPDSPVVDMQAANCAIFYSITNCLRGLRGISFGNMLIKQVAEDLGREFPRVKTFATLSPIPGFRTWLSSAAETHSELASLVDRLDAQGIPPGDGSTDLQRELERLCAYYLLHAKHGQEALDSVERFHLGNGARLERINWLGDTSRTGLQRSAGMMVNYVYRLGEVERNHEAYAREHRIVAVRRIEALAKESLLARNGGRLH